MSRLELLSSRIVVCLRCSLPYILGDIATRGTPRLVICREHRLILTVNAIIIAELVGGYIPCTVLILCRE